MTDKSIRLQVVEQVAALMTAAFAFIAALAWNGAISELVKTYLSAGSGWVGLMIYAIIVTIIAVIAAIYITRMAARIKESEAIAGKKAEKK
jgi:C4-dicarboxylate transporter